MRADFRLEDWIVSPRRGYIKRDNEIVHIHPKPMAVLECLAKARGEVLTRDEVFETVWPDVIVSDDALAQCVVELRKAFGDSASDSKIIRTIPKVGYCLIPPVTVLTEAKPASGNRPRSVFFGILAVVAAIAVIYLFGMIDGELDTPAPVGEESASIAVLPFVNRSLQAEDEYFSDGIHDELLTRLSQVSGLRVISRTSVNQYRDTDKTMPEIAGELSVATILEGSVQRTSDQVRINVQLIDAHADEHLWAETFDRQLTTANIFSIQTEVAEKIADSLQVTLTSEEKLRVASVPTDNYEAYEALLKGHRALKQGTVESVYEAIGFYQRALALKPGFAQAYLAMADAYLIAVEERGIADTEGLQKAEEFALKALQLNASLGGAYAHLARVERRSKRFEEAEKYYRQGIEYEPGNSSLHHSMGLTLRVQGRALEAVPYYDQAIRLDPLSPLINESRGSLLRDLGRFEDAENQYQYALLIAPEFVNTHWGLGTLYWSIGQPEIAIEWFGNAVRLKPYSDVFRAWLALMYLELGQDEQAQLVIEEALSVVLPEENDVTLMSELLLIYNGQDISGLPDGRQFMPRYWYGSIVDLPSRALLKGEFQQVVDQFEKTHPGIMKGQVEINGANYRAAIYVAFALKQLDQDEHTAELLDQIEAFINNIQRRGIRGYWISDVQIQMIRDNHAASLESLRQAVDEGWRNLWRFYLLHDPILEPLHTNLEFQEMVSTVEQDVLNQIGGQ